MNLYFQKSKQEETLTDPNSINFSCRPKEIVIFLLNGASYEEARFINYLNEIHPTVKIVLGSNFIHNNRSFIAEMFNEWTFNKNANNNLQ